MGTIGETLETDKKTKKMRKRTKSATLKDQDNQDPKGIESSCQSQIFATFQKS